LTLRLGIEGLIFWSIGPEDNLFEGDFLVGAAFGFETPDTPL
jgi:hypothetical protein